MAILALQVVIGVEVVDGIVVPASECKYCSKPFAVIRCLLFQSGCERGMVKLVHVS